MSLSSAAGYSQSMSMPSKPCCLVNSMAELINFLRVSNALAIFLNSVVPNVQPPNDNRVFNVGSISLSALTRLYKPAPAQSLGKSAVSYALENEDQDEEHI